MAVNQALDIFAGAGGWDVAARGFGWEVDRVEIMPEANATAAAAGFGEPVHHDVRTLHVAPGQYRLLLGSPSCKRFSTAGNGNGRRALDAIVEVVHSYLTPRPIGMEQAVEMIGDPDAALVLEPMRLIDEGRFPLVALEQVPSVLPVWNAYARVMRERGWSVVTGVLNAEQYGVPQTRRRAFLVASLETGHRPTLPSPTHSRYYSREPARLDSGVPPWVSMAQALGWGMTAGMGREMDEGRWEMRSNYTKGGDLTGRGTRSADHPSLTVTSKIGKNAWQPVEGDGRWEHDDPAVRAKGLRVTVPEATALQSFPADYPFQGRQGKQFLQVGNAVPPPLAGAVLDCLPHPAQQTQLLVGKGALSWR